MEVVRFPKLKNGVFWISIIFIFVMGLFIIPHGFTTAAGLLIADANTDCIVDENDFSIWKNHFLQNATTGSVAGDFNSSGFVDGIDFVIWLNAYNQRCPTPTFASTPRPTAYPTAVPTPRPTSTPIPPTIRPTPTRVPPTSIPIPTSNSNGSLSYEQVKAWAESYKATHPGNGGKDWDINNKTPAQIASDPAAQQLLSICGQNQRPVIPILAWEYGGSDHQWINPNASALVYCTYIPVQPSTSHWQYDPGQDRVTADVYVLFPNQNPCNNQQGKDQVIACLGDPTNSEILVDTASLDDGHTVGLDLANSSTVLNLLFPNGTRVQLLLNI